MTAFPVIPSEARNPEEIPNAWANEILFTALQPSNLFNFHVIAGIKLAQ